MLSWSLAVVVESHQISRNLSKSGIPTKLTDVYGILCGAMQNIPLAAER
jgi:hypothetical protein